MSIVGRAPNWLPSSMGSGCILWCRADLGVTPGAGGTVTTWNDQSPFKNNLAGANIGGNTNPIWNAPDAPQPSMQLSCNSADTAAGFFNVANPGGWNTGTGPIHLWAVVQMPLSWPATHTIHGPIFDKNVSSAWTGPNTGDGVGLGINVISNQGTWSFLYPGLLQAQNIPTTVMSNGQTYLVEYFWDGSTLSIWQNGAAIFSSVLGASYTSATQTNTLYIGIIGSISNRAFPGKILDIGAFGGGGVSKVTQALLQTYARNRYKIW